MTANINQIRQNMQLNRATVFVKQQLPVIRAINDKHVHQPQRPQTTNLIKMPIFCFN